MKSRRALSLLPVLLALLLPGLSAAQGKAQPAADEIRKLEVRRFAAMVKGDVAELGRMLGDDLTYGHSSGEVETKTQFLNALSQKILRYRAIRSQRIDVRLYSGVAVVNGVAAVEITTGGQDVAVTLRYTDVYVQRDGRWQMVAWQSTRLPK